MFNDKPLTQSGICERIWALMKADFKEFEREVEEHFALGYPGFTPVEYDYEQRIVWLRDDR